MRAARIIHEFLKWVWPATFGAVIAFVGIALTASQIWDGAKDWTADRWLYLVAVAQNPWLWVAGGAIFLVWLLAFIWSGVAIDRAERTPKFTPEPRTKAHSKVSAYGKAIGGRAEDEPGVSIGPIPTTEALKVFAAPTPEYIPLEEAGRWLYENASPGIREVLKGGVPSPFNSIAEHGAAFYRTAWTEERCSMYGRWEPGLPMELIDPQDGKFSAFEAVFGSDRGKPIDLSVLRQDLKPVLDYYERDEPALSRETVNVVRDKPLREALMFIVTRQWNFDPMTDGGDHLKGLSDALVEFRQHASDGAITVWGKADRSGVWQRIEPKYWVNHYVDLLDVLKSETRAKAYNQLATEPLFQELMVCRAEFEWEWRQVEA
ncbi:hypothetical protein [Phenylobacterium sp.]|uniref:hypothetical protein n=1 Tax=Phenylobacterium sp. TaxID=1871053 RepID=UPI0027336938|nr:hypothetical protein [Phenylobacterium sp.]MDP3632378.1 hypothetical protein [Phenylobacterium sp.]